MNDNRVLVLDDNPATAAASVRVARDCGYQAMAAASATAFYAEYVNWVPTLLVLDVVLGDTDVCEVLDFLGRNHCTIPIVLISGYDYRILHSVAKLARGRGLHVADVIEKAGAGDRLQAVLRAHAVGAAEQPRYAAGGSA
jgi:DNA-binding response OmpR family regulator